MVATDTVVGVVGAVLLAGVMVGVFVYEYNNTPASAQGNDDQARMASFASRYPTLNATQDLDGDHVENFKDPDMDGNGVADVNQTGMLVVRVPKPASISAPTPPATTSQGQVTTDVMAGNTGVQVMLYYNSSTPAPANTPSLSATLKGAGPDDEATGTASTPAPGTTAVTVTIDAQKGFAPGPAMVTVTESNGVPTTSTAFNVVFVLTYGPAMPKA